MCFLQRYLVLQCLHLFTTYHLACCLLPFKTLSGRVASTMYKTHMFLCDKGLSFHFAFVFTTCCLLGRKLRHCCHLPYRLCYFCRSHRLWGERGKVAKEYTDNSHSKLCFRLCTFLRRPAVQAWVHGETFLAFLTLDAHCCAHPGFVTSFLKGHKMKSVSSLIPFFLAGVLPLFIFSAAASDVQSG